MTEGLEGYEHYRQFMDKLAENDVDQFIDLPMIAVMGDTSSGKSSLLSNISLIELPSNDKLTTRCPCMLKMHNSKTRSASVKVCWKDEPEGAVDFKERTIKEENWHDITKAIADAQDHIIQMTGKEVARDIVSVDIWGPHCQNLTLIDLPGIVRTAGKSESATLSEDIQALMTDYLANTRCVILAVLPSNVDFHNSQILADARKVDPETKRTIPVLTKPDLIDKGGETSVKDLLLGKKTESFEMGFHMIKGRGQMDLDNSKSIEDGLASEDSFFNNTEPWRSVEDRALLGTKNLRVKLAHLQLDMIKASFKGIVADLKSQRDHAMSDYNALGEIPTDLMEKRVLFHNDVREDIWKGFGSNILSGGIACLHRDDVCPSAQFLDASRKYQDTLSLSKLATISDVKVGTSVICDEEEDIRGKVCFIDSAANKVYLENCVEEENVGGISDAKLVEIDGGCSLYIKSGRVFIKRENGIIDELKAYKCESVRPDPAWIRTFIQKNRPYKLPVFINTDVFEAIVADEIVREWAPPSQELLTFTAELMEASVETFIKEMKVMRSLPTIEGFLTDKALEIVDSLRKEAEDKVMDFIKREKVPYTQNHYLFENVCKLRSKRIMDEVMSSIKGLCGSGTAQVQVQPDSLSSMIRNIFQKNQERSVEDHMVEEMEIALNAYGKVAFKRFFDNVPMICVEIMEKFADELNASLCNTPDDVIDRIITASPGVIEKRDRLKRKVDVLDKGIVALREVF